MTESSSSNEKHDFIEANKCGFFARKINYFVGCRTNKRAFENCISNADFDCSKFLEAYKKSCNL